MFVRPLSGRNFGGIESHVRLPMTTALCFAGSVVAIVTSRKYAMSPGKRQGMLPSFPMPHSFDVATTTLSILLRPRVLHPLRAFQPPALDSAPG